MDYYGSPITKLIESLSKLPGVGNKSAQRLAFHIINMEENDVLELSQTLISAKQKVKYCSICCNLTDMEICAICNNSKRTDNIIMVVQEPRDMAAYERTNDFDGLYHILHGAISPMNGISPENLKIKELLERLKNNKIVEVILATNANIEGEATAMYINKLINPLGINVTRIAHGVPIGSDLEYVDQVTLSRALEGRIKM